MSRKIKKGIIIISVAFVLYNILWVFYVNYRYNPFCERFEKGSNIFRKDGFTFYVDKPNYLSFTGNIAICEDVIVSYGQTEAYVADLVIWPKGLDQYEVGVSVGVTTVNVEEHAAHTEYINILLDENGGLKEYSAENALLLEDYKDKIDHLYELAFDMWGLRLF